MRLPSCALIVNEGGALGATSDGLRVPLALRGDAGEIFAITDRFCHEHLDSEYAFLCRALVAKLARKRPSPLKRGELRIWAAGAVYTVGANNFLFDPSQTPHLKIEVSSRIMGLLLSPGSQRASTTIPFTSMSQASGWSSSRSRRQNSGSIWASRPSASRILFALPANVLSEHEQFAELLPVRGPP